ncbi:HAD hydrolase-like protein [Salmonella sp. WGH-01]|nr:HAD hydrolase-like protein [Salmonella sp. WGH-01]
MRAALNKMQAHSEETVIVGDNLRTDILAGFRRSGDHSGAFRRINNQ